MIKKKISIIGLGYVGLPLAVEFGKKRETIGFDINKDRINDLKEGVDKTLEISTEELKEAKKLNYTSDVSKIKDCEIFIITVPTPINNDKKPDLTSLIKATELVGSIIKKKNIIIYESTVYPGLTEEVCVPILESQSGLSFNKDFYCGYSPERINPGDKLHRLNSIKKITSGSTPKIAIEIDELYKEIITAGTYLASSIKVAEAAKVIENTQRDVNIALINEFAIIFNKLNIDTKSVLEAAETKWNFLPFKPGLVGGHCIGVDPYYIAYKAKESGYEPEMTLAGRSINDRMGYYVVNQVVNLMTKKKINITGSNILIMGFTFKENCPDIRNTQVVTLLRGFETLNSNVDIYDPWVDKNKALEEYNIDLIDLPIKDKYDAIILAVSHNEFKKLTIDQLRKFGKEKHIIYDIKYLLDTNMVDGQL
ncbi:Vi polysaccharide biosynthesis UDP-N-acetylglucosamine C-6 dehydrogenase TviB [Candidatus Pelagibacter sp.]|nr:Vi polysaccharide biosynthesis UDP-N-acetylglucosamine C-6 dehydrogenase TviB [Candidatus Pelagibacter sp.]